MTKQSFGELTPLRREFYTPISSAWSEGNYPQEFYEEVTFAIQAMKNNAYLAQSDRESILFAVLNVAQCGLTLNPAKNLAYLVPHKKKCVLYPSYQGLVFLLEKAGAIRAINCQLVYERDEFHYQQGSTPNIEHRPAVFSDDRGQIMGAYSVATMPDGTKHVEVMRREQIDNVRQTSESYRAYEAGKINSCPWVDYYGEMARKTVIKRHFKHLPKTGVGKEFYKAVDLDNQEYDFEATTGQTGMIDDLLRTANIAPQYQDALMEELSTGITQSRATQMIDYLLENQVDPVASGISYQQSDITAKLENNKQ